MVLFTANYIGLEVVGAAQIINAVFVLSPFVVLFFFCLPKWDTGRWGDVDSQWKHHGSAHDGIDWATWINVMFW